MRNRSETILEKINEAVLKITVKLFITNHFEVVNTFHPKILFILMKNHGLEEFNIFFHQRFYSLRIYTPWTLGIFHMKCTELELSPVFPLMDRIYDKESGRLRCRFGRNLGAQEEWKFSLINFAHISNYYRYLVSVGRGMGRKMFEIQKVLL